MLMPKNVFCSHAENFLLRIQHKMSSDKGTSNDKKSILNELQLSCQAIFNLL